MLGRTTALRAAITLASSSTAVWLSGGCNGSDVLVAYVADGGAATSFTEPDATVTMPDTAKLIDYCPSSQCPAGYATCPDSRFPCDVDLRTDVRNCGACGSACPSNGIGETFECVEGRCVMACRVDARRLDCDGAPDNGCETASASNENCGACGVECPDPANPCIEQGPNAFGCGCRPGRIYCASGNSSGACIDPERDDEHCGACGTACDPDGGGRERPPHTYFGCVESECGRPKCEETWGDCDTQGANGCEASLQTDDNCGACGNVCPTGTKCAADPYGSYFCACSNGGSFCPAMCVTTSTGEEFCIGQCFDLTSDTNNCGGCGISCDEARPNATPLCAYGSCVQRCDDGRADCNGNAADGCEVDTNSDPTNCGGCGVTCDRAAGQACVEGQCVVEPCDGPEGEEPTR